MESGQSDRAARRLLIRADRLSRRGLSAGVRGYQAYLGWLLGGQCRFEPSCSFYALEALQTHPTPQALGLVAWRLGRCHPLCRGGFDPVPAWKGSGEWVLNGACHSADPASQCSGTDDGPTPDDSPRKTA